MEKLIRKIIPASILSTIRILLKTPVLIRHKGKHYQCPICGYRSREWKVIGNASPVNADLKIIGAGLRKAGCYKCNSTDKDRLKYLYLEEFFKKRKEYGTILHFAPERGIYNFINKQRYTEYITADLFPDNFRYFAPQIKKMDIQNIPLEEGTVDLLICSHVLEHIPDDTVAMKELYRVLKPGGTAILQVPISAILEKTKEDFSIVTEEGRTMAFGQSDHVRVYGQDYFDRLSSVGFFVEKINQCTDEKKIYFGLNPKETLFIATK
jgi:SAM-dependent methyltransferase